MAQLYDLPTQRYAGRFIVQLDPLRDWSGVPGVILASDSTAWLDYTRLPTSGGSTENRLIRYEIQDGADYPVRTLTATLHLNTANGSLSSSAVNSPFNLLHPGGFTPAIFGQRRILVQEPLSDPSSTDPNDWIPRFDGYIDEHPASASGDLQIFARDASARLMKPYIGESVWIGEEGDFLPLDEAVQKVLDAAFGKEVWRVKSPDEDLEWAIPAFRFGASQVDNVLQFVRDMAQQRGAVVRWWPDEDTGRFQLTLFVLQQDKSDPEFVYEAHETEDIPQHGSDTSTYRNHFKLTYIDAVTGRSTTIERPATQSEIAAFGLQPFEISEASTSLIDSEDEAEAMLDYVETLRIPATVGVRRIPRNPSIEVNTLIEFGSDARISQEPVQLYVVNWREVVSANGERVDEFTEISLRGAPVGQLAGWLRSIQNATLPVSAASLYGFTRFTEVPHPTDPDNWRRFIVETGPRVVDIWWATKIYDAPRTEVADEDIARRVESGGGTALYLDMPRPAAGQVTLLRAEPRYWKGNDLVVYDEGGINLVVTKEWAPEPALINGWCKASNNGGRIDVTVGCDPTLSALPVSVTIHEGAQNGAQIAAHTFHDQASARAGIGPETYSLLGGRPGPTIGEKTWWARFVDTVGNVQWAPGTFSNPNEGGIGSDFQFSTGYDPIRYVDDLLTPGARDGQRVIVRSTKEPYVWNAELQTWEPTELDSDGPFFAPAFVANSVTAEVLASIRMEVGKEIASTDYEEGVSGWRIGGEGNAEFNTATIRGTLDGADGSFSGSLTAPVLEVSGTLSLLGGIPPNDTGLPTNAGVIQWGGIGGGARIMQDDSPRSIVFQLRDLTGDWYDVASLSAPTNPGETALSLRVNVGGTPEFRRVVLNGDALEAPEP